MRKTRLIIVAAFVALSLLLLSSCMTVYSNALGAGAIASMPIGAEGEKPSVDVSINDMRTSKFKKNDGKDGLLFVDMWNLSYSIPTKTLQLDWLFGPAFDINLNKRDVRLSIGIGPIIKYSTDRLDSYEYSSPDFLHPGLGLASSLRFGKWGISGFISANLSLTGVVDSPLKFGIKGGVFITAILKDISPESSENKVVN